MSAQPKEKLRILPGALLEAAVELGTIQLLKEAIRKNPPEIKGSLLTKLAHRQKTPQKSKSSFIGTTEETKK